MKLRNVKGGRLEELKNLKLVLAAAIDGYSDPKALPRRKCVVYFARRK